MALGRVVAGAALGTVLAAGCKPTPLAGEPGSPLTARPTEGGPAAGQNKDLPLVEIGGRALTLGEFEARAAMLSDPAQHRLNTTQGRTDLLEMFVWTEVLAQEATREGLVGTPIETLVVRDVQARAALDNAAALAVDHDALGEAQDALYDEFAHELNQPERRRAYGIIVDDEATAQRVRADLERSLEHAEPAHVFRRLATYYSDHPACHEDGGRYGWVTRPEDGGTADPVLAEALFGMEESGLGPIVQTSRGWEVLYLAAVQEAREVPREDAAPYLLEVAAARASARAQREALDAARADGGVQLDAAAIAALEAARVDDQVTGERARRYSEAALANDPSVEVGEPVANELLQAVQARGDNPRVVPALDSGNGEGSGGDLQ